MKTQYSKRVISFLCSLVIGLSVFMQSGMFSVVAEDENGQSNIIVSLGDSYSSGEGIDDFYDSDKPLEEKIKSQDWLSHRSQNAWSGMLELPSVGKMSEHRNQNWYFAAMSGAITANVWDTEPITRQNQKDKDYRYKYYQKGRFIGKKEITPQIQIFDQLNREGKKADYVTLTMGGNDAGFSDIISGIFLGSQINNTGNDVINETLQNAADKLIKDTTDGVAAHVALPSYNYVNVNLIHDKLTAVWQKFYQQGGIRDNLKRTYEEIEKAAGQQAHIIVAGYPLLFDTDTQKIDKTQAKEINDNVHAFNEEIRRLVEECQSEGMNIAYVSVEDEFQTHGAYSASPWINPVDLGLKEQDLRDIGIGSAYSMHPNKDGAEAYAKCVQAEIDRWENQKKAPATATTTETGSSSTAKTNLGERDVVLVLDTSGSMNGEPLTQTKKAANQFIDSVVDKDVKVGIVSYSDRAEIISPFSDVTSVLHSDVDKLQTSGSTNMGDGLAKAESMLDTSNAKKKIIILMSDGLPNCGKSNSELITYANELKEKGFYIYTLGFFDNLNNSYNNKSEAQQLMEQIASEGCHYEVSDAESLVYFFGDIADQINGQRFIYIRIACPVDVEVSYNGEVLSSSLKNRHTRTSFGTLTFEENEAEEASSQADTEENEKDTTKVLRLKEGTDYDISIDGTGKGKMDYSIGLMNNSNEYTDFRKFRNIQITRKTHIDTVAQVADETVLKVDEDGDGKYDLTYVAKANSRGELVDNSWRLYLLLALVGVLIILILFLIIAIKIREAKAKTIKCSECRTKNSTQYSFCKKCGKPLPNREKQGKKIIIIPIVLMILVVVGMAAVIVLWIMSNSENTVPKRTKNSKESTETATVSIATEEPATEVPTDYSSSYQTPTEPDKTEVPDVKSMKGYEAILAVLDAGFNVELTEAEEAEKSIPRACVAEQSPEAGETWEKEANIKLYLSNGNEDEQESTETPTTSSSDSTVPYFNSVTASSVLKESYNAKNLTKNDGECWCEGVKGNCKGEYILFASSGYQNVSGIDIVNGFSKSTTLFNENGRVKTLRFEFSDGTYIDKDIDDTMSLQHIEFGNTVSTNLLKIYIWDYVNGSKYEDICISYICPF